MECVTDMIIVLLFVSTCTVWRSRCASKIFFVTMSVHTQVVGLSYTLYIVHTKLVQLMMYL